MDKRKKEASQVEHSFTKEQLVKSEKYMQYVDFLSGNLQDGEEYTIKQVDKLISSYYGKGKSE